jgi:RNA-directed DNA polymerase
MIIHCKTKTEALSLKMAIEKRLQQCGLELHPEKTQVVYCKDANRKENFSVKAFDFLGYTFRPRLAKSREGKYFASFSPGISKKAANSIRQSMREWKLQSQCHKSLDDIAKWINPKLRGWFNYYGQYYKTGMYPIFALLNMKLAKWARGKYKKLKGHPRLATHWLGKIAKRQQHLFVHWQLSIRPSAG